MNTCSHILVCDLTMVYSVDSKGWTLIRGKSIDESLIRIILDTLIAECYRKLSVVALWVSTKWLTPKCEQQAELVKSTRRKECDHVSTHFWFDKRSHVTKIVDVWRHSQLSCLSLNSRSTCFGSTLSLLLKDSKWVLVPILSCEDEFSFTCKLHLISHELLFTRPHFEKET